MSPPLRVVILEDNAADCELTAYELKRAGYQLSWSCVQTEEAFVAALQSPPDLIIADYQLPQFDGARALALLNQTGLDVPFIIVSGAVGEERAVELMRQGAADYLLKDRLARLGEAVRRALEQKHDRDERARAVEASRALAARMEQQARTFDTLLSAVPDLLALIDPELRYTYANRAFAERLGVTAEQLVGRSAVLVREPELADTVRAEFARAFRGEVVRGEGAFPNREGNTTHYEYFLAPVFGAGGEIVAIASAARDITRRREAEQALLQARDAVAQQQRWLEMVLDLLPLPVIMVDPLAGATLFANDAACRMYGGPIPKDVPAYEVFRFAGTDGAELPVAEMPAVRAARGEQLAGMEALWNTAAGSYHLSFSSKTLPSVQGGEIIVLVFQDITGLKRTEATLRDSIEQLQRERELRELFVSTLSHDLRTPLVAARMSAELLARQEAGGAAGPRLQQRVLENIDRLDGMIQSLLDANLIRAGQRLPISVAYCSLLESVQCVADELSTVHGDRFRIEAPGDLPGYWDARFLRRIVENLLSNAVKYGDENAPVTIDLTEDGALVRISVHNEGEPISPEDQAVLFEPFRRASAGGSQGKRGWGIGLTLVRGAAEAHGGSVAVDSAPGRGTTFTVSLPRDARPPG
jgi:PAS domain S-box-containing protein